MEVEPDLVRRGEKLHKLQWSTRNQYVICKNCSQAHAILILVYHKVILLD